MIRFALLSAIILFTSGALSTTAEAQAGWPKEYKNALVVTADKHASKVGQQILQQGGNAVDAAVAVQFALAVTLPRAGNIGGGGFMVIRLADGTTNTLDFREKAPLKATRDMYIRDGEFKRQLSWIGALAVGVPGTVDGMVKALERYGKLPLDVVLAPAIKLAREGFPISYSLANSLNSHRLIFNQFDSSSLYFTKKDSSLFEEGEVLVQEDLAKTLDRIAQFGREGFYSGVTARMIVDEIQNQGGLITFRDLRNYESKWRKPVTTTFKGYELHMMPPPSSGSIAIAQILSMMDDQELRVMGHNSADYIHLLTETMRRAFADRAHYLGDPDFWEIPTDVLLSESYNADRMNTYSEFEATPSSQLSHGKVVTYQESSQTTHFSIIDEKGNAVSVTTTLNGSYGSHLAVGGAGFLLNNEMDDFSAQPGEPNAYGLIGGEANAIEPGKRMLSSMTPTIVTQNGRVKMVLGAAGGPRIITAVLQNFLNIAVFGMNAQQAVSAPRVHHQWLPDHIRTEPFGLNPDTQFFLEQRGHEFNESSGNGRAHIIHVGVSGILESGVDPRGDGYASGY